MSIGQLIFNMSLPLAAGVITLFPEMLDALNYGITGRAIRSGLLAIQTYNPRDYTTDVHRTVDDRPYGGGPGMIMRVEPLQAAILAAKVQLGQHAKVVYLSPQGKRLTQTQVAAFATQSPLILISGRYEGIDERLITQSVDEECSIGDYVLSGGELAVMVLLDAITRLLPGALGHPASAEEDSFAKGLLDYPHYTRPEEIAGQTVPSVLLSGDHAAIARWRLQQALGRTWLRRPDLLENLPLTQEEQQLLTEFINSTTLNY